VGLFVRRRSEGVESRPAETPEQKALRLRLKVEGFLISQVPADRFLRDLGRTDFLSDLTPILLKHGPQFERTNPVRFQQLLEAAGVAEWYRRKRARPE
jgi:hypothetical protein